MGEVVNGDLDETRRSAVQLVSCEPLHGLEEHYLEEELSA